MEATQSTEAAEKEYRTERSPGKLVTEQGLHPQKAVARVRNLEPFGGPAAMFASAASRPHLPQIHNGRQVGRYLQLEVSDGFFAGESNDAHGPRDTLHAPLGSKVRLSSHQASPPSLIARAAQAAGAIDAG